MYLVAQFLDGIPRVASFQPATYWEGLLRRMPGGLSSGGVEAGLISGCSSAPVLVPGRRWPEPVLMRRRHSCHLNSMRSMLEIAQSATLTRQDYPS